MGILTKAGVFRISLTKGKHQLHSPGYMIVYRFNDCVNRKFAIPIPQKIGPNKSLVSSFLRFNLGWFVENPSWVTAFFNIWTWKLVKCWTFFYLYSFKQTWRGSCHVPPFIPKNHQKTGVNVEDFPHHHLVSPLCRWGSRTKLPKKRTWGCFQE